MNKPDLPDDLIASIASDCRPVKPLAQHWRRCLPIAAVAAAIAGIALATIGLRSDLGDMPLWLSWGGFALGIGIGLILTALALREAIPGRALPTGVVIIAIASGVGFHLIVSIMTSVEISENSVTGGSFMQGCGCFMHEFLFALPAFAITLWLIWRAMPTRSGVAGGLGAAGAAIIADSITHLQCPISRMDHILVWHTGAILAIVAIGWLAGHFWPARNSLRRS